jgi:6-phosphogluconolactonase
MMVYTANFNSNMSNDFVIYPSPTMLAETFAKELVSIIKKTVSIKGNYTLALSGGNTPQLLFSVLAEIYSDSINWSLVHFFWVDERCVPPDDPESNFGNARRILLDKINIPYTSVHRIRGEDDPEKEAERYSAEILNFMEPEGDWPVFDHIVLGMGDDGHTASIFPDNRNLLNSREICAVSKHPQTNQERVTITGRVINNAANVTFLVTGDNKSLIINEIFRKHINATNYPAAYIIPYRGKIRWLLDKNAASLL